MKSFFQWLKNLNIRTKLLGGHTLIIVLAVMAGGGIIISRVQTTIETHIESELANATAAIRNMVRTAAATSIKNHLRAVAEKNLEIVQAVYQEFEQDLITETQAKELCRKILFSQTIGKTGYIFCASSQGIATEHPNPGVTGKRFMDRSFVREMIRLKTGYLEYEWKNPEEDVIKPKAMYMSYFAPWDWIIAVSTYREEFTHLIEISDFRKSILDMTFGKTGYAYIHDSSGNLIVHPFLTGNYLNSRDKDGRYFVRDLCEKKNGKAVYSWENPGEKAPREKLVIFNYIPEYDWIVASASYLDEIYSPLNTMKTIVMGILALIFLLITGSYLWVNRSIITPLQSLMKRFDQGAAGDFSVRMPVRATDEIGQLAGYFNRFMDKLELFRRNLESEISMRKTNEQALRLSEEMFSKAFRSNPAGMFIAVLSDSRIISANDSFLNITGYNLMDLLGREILTLDFFSPRREGRWLFRKIRERRPVKNKEIIFRTRAGERHQGVISAEWVMVWGEACLLAAMEDMTDTRRLEQEILKIGLRERQNIAMSLHDDLCPQLIGIEVMVKMLHRHLDSSQARSTLAGEIGRTEKIRAVIRDAIHKTRTLSRGLEPVNLADRGFDISLASLADYIREVFSISCNLDWQLDQPPFADDTEATHAYYIVHEAVHNAVKHAEATRIDIVLTSNFKNIRMEIRDNGKGGAFPTHTRGMGIRIMTYRAARIGGTLVFEPISTGGTRVILELDRHPFEEAPHNEKDCHSYR
ncbi:MAG: cache domain-containing protein [Desulfotignum sp.]|jgi:PAS domain S-box-containing protein|nr:cache domain-containing protein [Desulfotignum sp.]